MWGQGLVWGQGQMLRIWGGFMAKKCLGAGPLGRCHPFMSHFLGEGV